MRKVLGNGVLRTSIGALRDKDKVQNVNSDLPYDLIILQWPLLASSFHSSLILLKKLESLFTFADCYYSEGATNRSICYRIHSTGGPAAKNILKEAPLQSGRTIPPYILYYHYLLCFQYHCQEYTAVMFLSYSRRQ
jgi:hypothetical protein